MLCRKVQRRLLKVEERCSFSYDLASRQLVDGLLTVIYIVTCNLGGQARNVKVVPLNPHYACVLTAAELITLLMSSNPRRQ
jgi:hypothetical protein